MGFIERTRKTGCVATLEENYTKICRVQVSCECANNRKEEKMHWVVCLTTTTTTPLFALYIDNIISRVWSTFLPKKRWLDLGVAKYDVNSPFKSCGASGG